MKCEENEKSQVDQRPCEIEWEKLNKNGRKIMKKKGKYTYTKSYCIQSMQRNASEHFSLSKRKVERGFEFNASQQQNSNGWGWRRRQQQRWQRRNRRPCHGNGEKQTYIVCSTYVCVGASKRVSIEENYYFLWRARIRHMKFVYPCCAPCGKTVWFSGYFPKSVLPLRTECEWNASTIHCR